MAPKTTPNFRRGAAAIAESKKKAESGGKNFKPFAPRIAWDDGDTKHVLFLTPIEESPTVEMHEYVPIGEWKSKDGKKKGTTYGFYISRKDQAIGEDHDILVDEFDKKPTERTLGVAVELEPIYETVRGRKRPVGFEVKTDTYTRKGDDDQDEEITTPIIGVVAQSSSNFFGYLGSFDEEQAPVIETPFSIKREGGGTDTEYHFVHFMDQPVDLSPVTEYLEGILYLDDQLDDLFEEVDDLDSTEAALVIANAILETRLDELSDLEKYQEDLKGVKKIRNPYGEDYVRNVDAGETDDSDESEDEPEEEPKKRTRRRSTSKRSTAKKDKPKDEESVEEAEAEADGKADDGDDDDGEDVAEKRTRFAEMRKKAERTTKSKRATAKA